MCDVGKAPRSLWEMQFWLFADALLADFPRPIKVGIYVVSFFRVVFLGTSLSSLSAKKEPSSRSDRPRSPRKMQDSSHSNAGCIRKGRCTWFTAFRPLDDFSFLMAYLISLGFSSQACHLNWAGLNALKYIYAWPLLTLILFFLIITRKYPLHR